MLYQTSYVYRFVVQVHKIGCVWKTPFANLVTNWFVHNRLIIIGVSFGGDTNKDHGEIKPKTKHV